MRFMHVDYDFLDTVRRAVAAVAEDLKAEAPFAGSNGASAAAADEVHDEPRLPRGDPRTPS